MTKRAANPLFRLVLIGLAGTVAIVVMGLGIQTAFAPPMDYTVRARFDEMPPNDDALRDWLLGQPGVYIGFVERDGAGIVICWGHTETTRWHPATPNVRDEFDRFGYKGLAHYEERKGYRDK